MAAASSHNDSISVAQSAPRLAPLTSQLALPAYLALFVATGIAGYVLAYHIDTTAFSVSFGTALILALVATYAANHGSERARSLAKLGRFVTVPALLFISVLTTPEVFLSREFASDSNSIMAAYIGLIMVVSILLIGLRVEGRPVPIAMPLVATLSLFGLLNLVIVDTIVQVGFLMFVAASLFLIGYERLLSHWQKRFAHGPSHQPLNDPQLQNAARSFLAASVAWFTIFVAGAALFYQPLLAALPGILPTPLGRLSNSQAQTDWRHSPRQVEVRGGNHTLSEREVLKIRLLSGQSQGYWRGRVYQNYTASSWQDDTRSFKDARLRYSQLTPLELHETLPPLDTKLGREVTVKADMAPLAFLGSPVPLYGAGRITAMRAAWSDIDINTRTSAVTLTWSPFTYSAEPQYTVESKYIEPLAASLRARSMTDTELKEWRGNEATAPTLELPDDSLIKEPIQRIAQEIITSAQQQGRKIDTPRAKAQAISAYLHANCVYSLNAPLAPSTDDGVAYFLTTSKLGACDMFASAMALLLRAMDVPSRLATGYLEPEAASGATPGEILIREKDAHAWVEYWVPELGWITHDPSAGTRVADEGVIKNLSQTIAALMRRIGGTTVLLPIFGVLLLLAGLFWPQIEKMIGGAAQPADAQSQQRARVSRAYAQATRMVRRHVHGRRHSLAPFTPRELDDAVGNANLSPEAKQEFAALTYLHAAARYAPTMPDVNEAQLKESLNRLRQALR